MIPATLLYNARMNFIPSRGDFTRRSARWRHALAALAIAILATPITSTAQDMSGLRIGMTRAEVEKITGRLSPLRQSALRNAFAARKIPGESKNPLFAFAERDLYFDQAGRLWRIRIRIHGANGQPFAPAPALAFYRSMGARMESAHKLYRVEEAPPVWMPAASCEEARNLQEKHAPGTASPAPAEPPPVGEAGIVVMQVGCGITRRWSRTFVATGNLAHEVALADGTPTSSPVIYQIYRFEGETPDDTALFRRMMARRK